MGDGTHAEGEEWRAVPGFDDWYDVSSKGRVRAPVTNADILGHFLC